MFIRSSKQIMAIVKTIKLKVKKLSPESFKPYGKIIGKQSSKPSYSEKDLNFWEGIDELNFSNGTGQLSWLELTYPRALICEELERHIDSGMGIIPVTGKSLIVFGLSKIGAKNKNALPDLNSIKAFSFDGSKGVNIKPGVWFWIRYTLSKKSTYAIILKRNFAVQIINLRDNFATVFEIVL